MNLKIRSLAAFLLLTVGAACGGSEAQPEADTEDLNRSLLSAPVTDGRTTPVAVDPELAQQGPRVPVAQVGINRGSVDAPVKVLEMSDYGCSYCRQFHQETFPTLYSEFIETGMVEWKFVPFVTGMFGNSVQVTEAAECVYAQNEATFEELNDRLWNEQAAWKGSDDPAALVREWVDALDVDMTAYDQCLAQDERLGRVASSTSLAAQLGVRGTPTFVVIGYPPLQGALPLDMFREVLSAVHARETAAGAVGGEGSPQDETGPEGNGG
ncbi:MAG: thioredoxin domain-containing protein [Longimicrobiales bacterium]|nr:thioredoxin domain-containing protein [Longimicrobiales bacterium]